MSLIPRRLLIDTIDLKAVRRSLAKMAEVRRRQVAEARAKLDAIMRRVARPGPDGTARGARKRGFTLRLEAWQIRAARLLSTIRGEPYQERLREWLAAAMVHDWRASRRRKY